MNFQKDFVQILSVIIGCAGFSMLLRMRYKQIFFAGIAACLTWISYLIFYNLFGTLFLANLFAAMFAGIIAEVLARKRRSPATIYLTAAGVPLFPGAKLYYCMFGMVTEQPQMAESNGIAALIIAAAIALGFVTVAVMNQYINRILNKPKKIAEKALRKFR